MSFINFNGKTVLANAPIISAGNRGLRYGDGLFETIKYKNGQLILLDDHLARLWNGLHQLKFEIPRLFHPDRLERETMALIQKNKLQAARVRISIFRGSGGLYDPEQLSPQYLIETFPLPENNGAWNENGLQVCLFQELRKHPDAFSRLKHNNFLPYVMGAFFAKENKCNDALLLNTNGHIADSTIANVFVIKDQIIHTPPISDGCIDGIMRKAVIQTLKQNNQHVMETSISPEFLFQAEEVFLTNSIYNMRWVGMIAHHRLSNGRSREIFNSLRETIPTVFC